MTNPVSPRLGFAQAASLVTSLKKRAPPSNDLQDSPWNVFSTSDGSNEPLPAGFLVSEPDSIKDEDLSSDENDSHADDEHQYRPAKPVEEGSSRLAQLRNFLSQLSLTSVQKNILKCAIAYMIASLFTFVRPLSTFVGLPTDAEGPVANAHFIATIATYYNPAKTMGNMTEANIFCAWAALFSVLVCFGSMTTAVVLNNDNFEWLSHTLVLVVWLGGSCGLVAYLKTSVGRPTFGSACSMAVLINSVIICREGAVHLGRFETAAILQTLFICAIGILISNIVCLTIWRGSAVSLLQGSLNKTLDSFGTLIGMLSSTFMLEEGYATSDARLKEAIKAHEAAFSSLKSQLQDAKLEFFSPRIQRSHETYDEIVRSMTRLAQHLTGLRSGCNFQSKVLKLRKAARTPNLAQASFHCTSPDLSGKSAYKDANTGPERSATLTEEVKVFLSFQELLGDTLGSVTKLCKRSCKTMRTSFTHSRANYSQLASNDLEAGDQIGSLSKLHLQLGEALSDFTIAHGKALKVIYKNFPNTVGEGEQAPEVLQPRPNEGIFTIYFFLFNLEEFAKELLHLMELFIAIREEEESLDRRRMVLDSRYGRVVSWFMYALDVGNVGRMPSARKRTKRFKTLYDRLTTLIPVSTSKQLFPDVSAAAETSQMVDPSSLSLFGRLQHSLWRFSLLLKTSNAKFAIKTGIGAAILGLPAFLDATRPTWVALRMEWAMISYQVVIANTTAQSNFNAVFRVAGTMAGALVAIAIYHASHENPYALVLAGFLFSIPNFWLIVTRPKFATTGRFILLAYNLTALYAFNKRELDIHVSYIALKRVIAVVIGTLWAWLVSVSIWPYEARKELRTGLSTLFLNSAFLYEKLVRAYSTPPAALQTPSRPNFGIDNTNPNEHTSLLSPSGRGALKKTVDEFAAMELYLQRSLISLQGLLDQTVLEPRLKGPFPAEAYRKLLLASQAILDQLHSMRAVTTREEWYFDVRRDFILPVQAFRREMVGNVLLYFSLLASILTLKTSVPAYLPPAAAARQRLVDAIRSLEVVQRRAVKNSSTYLLYYSYAMAMKDLVDQLDVCAALLRELFGTLGEDFESLFHEVDPETPV